MYAGENIRGFHDFSLNCESFPANYGFVDQQYKSTEMLQPMFYHEYLFSTSNAKFPCRCFSVYGKMQSFSSQSIFPYIQYISTLQCQRQKLY